MLCVDLGDTMRKVLIITFFFPPHPEVGGLRIQGLAKYLPEFGWEPIILAPKLPGKPDKRFKVIQTPYHDIISSWKKRFGFRADKTVKEQLGVRSKKNKRTLVDYLITLAMEVIAYPDAQKGWYPYAVKAAEDIIKQEKVDAIISSSKPETCHLIAKELKVKYSIPWIADLRDLWTQNHYYPYSLLRKFRERRLEIKTLKEADALVTVSQPLAEKLKILHKEKPVYVIPNGFDPEEINPNPACNLTKKFSITYTGRFYEGKRDPSKLFEALCDLISKEEINSNEVEVRFYGPVEDWLREDIKHYRLENIVKIHGTVPRKIALEKQRESQILLLLLWDHPEEIGVYTAKIFEYLAAQRPILAINGPPRSVVKELLNETGAGVYARSVEEIKDAIRKFYCEYKSKGFVEYHGKRTKVFRYSQKEMARKFSIILNKITKT